jgi:hypothetical protein
VWEQINLCVYVDVKLKFHYSVVKTSELKTALYKSEVRFCSPQFLELSVKHPAVFIYVLVVVHVLIIRTWKQYNTLWK